MWLVYPVFGSSLDQPLFFLLVRFSLSSVLTQPGLWWSNLLSANFGHCFNYFSLTPPPTIFSAFVSMKVSISSFQGMATGIGVGCSFHSATQFIPARSPDARLWFLYIISDYEAHFISKLFKCFIIYLAPSIRLLKKCLFNFIA